ncbi:cache domain-containing protein [uncultured Rhodospira sp.]|uniref:methyl-accepting chemotaxis protein n=1 Tax=uncultured Rhodospira sp. TaxID=1936189 RepID=UPI0026317418|nr:cache domain-containing protein [uncultured Rhodospira sp.]
MSRPKLTITLRVALVVLVNTLLIGVTVAVAMIVVLNRDAERNAVAAIDQNMRVAWDEIREYGADVRLEDEALVAGSTVLNGNNEIVDEIVAQVGGTATIFMGDTRVATNVVRDDGSRAVGTTLARNAAYESVFFDKEPFRGIVDILGQSYITGYDPILGRNGDVIGILYVGTKVDQFFASLETLRTWILVILAGCGVLGLAIGLLVARVSIVRPLKDIVAAMETLSGGDLSVSIPHRGASSEIGTMAGAVQGFKENAQEVRRLQTEQAAQQRRSARQVQGEMLALTSALDEQVRQVMSAVADQAQSMCETARGMAQAVGATAGGADSAAEASRNSASSVDAVAAAAEQMAASISEISRQVTNASATAQRAAEHAAGTNDRIGHLADSATKIGEVVDLINDIAKQTNLLALNATIEAARAGEAGKGFAVVAGEVKALANQTSRATDSIADQVADMQAATNEAVEAVKAISGVISEFNEITSTISSATEEQTATTREISNNAQRAAQGTQGVSDGIREVSGSAETTARHAGEVETSAQSVLDSLHTMEQALGRIMSATTEGDRRGTALRTVNVAVTVDLSGEGQTGGESVSCLLQALSPLGAGVLDRTLPCEPGRPLRIGVPELGSLPATVVVHTDAVSHLRLDLDDNQIEALRAWLDRRARAV